MSSSNEFRTWLEHFRRRALDMEEASRFVVAFVAAHAAGKSHGSTVTDRAMGRSVRISGTVSDAQVSIFDFSRNCHISGAGKGGKYTLFDFGLSAHLSLQIAPTGQFSGFDFGTSTHFSGSVHGRSIQMFDYGVGQHFSYLT